MTDSWSERVLAVNWASYDADWCGESTIYASPGTGHRVSRELLRLRGPTKLLVELLDIFFRFTQITDRAINGRPDWAAEVRRRVGAARIKFEVLAGHPDEEVSAFAQGIVELLDAEILPRLERIASHGSGEPRTRSRLLRPLRCIVGRFWGTRG